MHRAQKTCFLKRFTQLMQMILILNAFHTIASNLPPVKHILMWMPLKYRPSKYDTTIYFTKHDHCTYKNCLLTSNREMLKDTKLYDALIFDFFHGDGRITQRPPSRSDKQIYIFAHSGESAQYYPACDLLYDNFFNMTLSYRLDSDIPSPYFYIKDKTGKVIGPSANMNWIKAKDMSLVNEKIKLKLQKKYRTAAWIVSNCNTLGKRHEFVEKFRTELEEYGLDIDIYGHCYDLRCGTLESKIPDCWKFIEENYFFYLSFENSICEDYVTEKLLNPLQHYTVPIVYGGANYSRFLPDGSYLNALEVGEKNLAEEIVEIMENRNRYYSFFKWRKYYSYHKAFESADTDAFCKLCAFLNKQSIEPIFKEYENFVTWWNVPGVCRNYKVIDLLQLKGYNRDVNLLEMGN